MELYYFTKAIYGLSAIRSQTLKIATIEELNDPFELIAPIGDTYSTRWALRSWKADVSKTAGMVCLSSDWQHPLQWSHYADKHQGLALGFDVVQADEFHAVNYVEERPKFPGFGKFGEDWLADETIELLVTTKFSAWSYESEYRTFVELDEPEAQTGLHFLPFSPRLKLTKVLVGARSHVTRADIGEALAGHASGVEAFQVRPAFKNFAVTRNLLETAWE